MKTHAAEKSYIIGIIFVLWVSSKPETSLMKLLLLLLSSRKKAVVKERGERER
jgi:hypothetical protein